MKEASEDDVVIRSVAETAVYLNPNHDVVIRQECWGQDDMVVIVPVEYIARLIDALQKSKEDALSMMKG